MVKLIDQLIQAVKQHQRDIKSDKIAKPTNDELKKYCIGETRLLK